MECRSSAVAMRLSPDSPSRRCSLRARTPPSGHPRCRDPRSRCRRPCSTSRPPERATPLSPSGCRHGRRKPPNDPMREEPHDDGQRLPCQPTRLSSALSGNLCPHATHNPDSKSKAEPSDLSACPCEQARTPHLRPSTRPQPDAHSQHGNASSRQARDDASHCRWR